MTFVPLKFLSEARLAELRAHIGANLVRYTESDFLDLARENGWSVESPDVQMDVDALAALDGSARTADADVENSLVLHRALKGMTPALAREERVWARLAHVECLPYAKNRWIAGTVGEPLVNAISKHMFAAGLTGVRDDNAISRLWWNRHIAGIADPDDPEGALRLLVKRADIRTSVVERSLTGARRPLVRAIVRGMRREPWLTSSEQAFRNAMIALNRDGGGVLFEALDDSEADRLVDQCIQRAMGGLSSGGRSAA